MFTIEVERWLPDFILADKNGYAIATTGAPVSCSILFIMVFASDDAEGRRSSTVSPGAQSAPWRPLWLYACMLCVWLTISMAPESLISFISSHVQ